MGSGDFTVITNSANLENLLNPFHSIIGDDFAGYRGHLYRVLNYSLWLLAGEKKYRAVLEFVLVYHDIGLWTARKLAYLEPSIEAALLASQKEGHGFDPQLLKDIIFYHHKVFAFRGPNATIVNAFRKADWIDFSQGKIKKGVPAEFIYRVKEQIPAAGFYAALDRLGPELSDHNRLKMVGEFLKVFKI